MFGAFLAVLFEILGERYHRLRIIGSEMDIFDQNTK
jgi:hypothetical protein